eukprot:m.207042 g.207042  ORF g.207042 m.207042 type:complete len:69 (+) comp15441_c0_seq1:709-915(+)
MSTSAKSREEIQKTHPTSTPDPLLDSVLGKGVNGKRLLEAHADVTCKEGEVGLLIVGARHCLVRCLDW